MSAVAPWIREQAQALLAQRGHAWLLSGPSGLGQYALALELVRAWLCEQPTAQGACGACGSCHAVEVRTHADLCVLMPETQMQALGWPLPEKAQQELDDKKRKPSREIRVEAMRDAIEFAQRTSARGRGKAVLVYPAERMNTVTANALLKTLEEPPGDVRFVLASEAAHQLLPTIRSRCLGHTMRWPHAAQSESWLAEQGVPAGDVPVLLRAAGGRPEEALALARAGRGAKSWSQLPRAIARGDVSALADCSPPRGDRPAAEGLPRPAGRPRRRRAAVLRRGRPAAGRQLRVAHGVVARTRVGAKNIGTPVQRGPDARIACEPREVGPTLAGLIRRP